MNAKCSPAIPFNASIRVVGFPPFASGDNSPIFAGNARQAAMFVKFSTVGTAIRGIDKTIGQFSGFHWHLSGSSSTYKRHNNWWPAERRPMAAMAWWFGQHRTQMLKVSLAGKFTEDRCKMHSITFAGPDLSDSIIVAEPVLLPHLQ